MKIKNKTNKSNILKGLRIEVMTFNNNKKTKKKVADQLNNHLLNKVNAGYFNKLLEKQGR